MAEPSTPPVPASVPEDASDEGAPSYTARMRRDLSHLPQAKREQIAAVMGLIGKAAPADIVVLFGSHYTYSATPL